MEGKGFLTVKFKSIEKKVLNVPEGRVCSYKEGGIIVAKGGQWNLFI